MKKTTRFLKHAMGFVAIFFGLGVCWLLAYFITVWFYDWTGTEPHGLLRQLIGSFLGFFIFGTAMFTISKIGRFREKRMAIFHSLTDALAQIARGNFDVDLGHIIDPEKHPDHPFGQLVTSINELAVDLGEMENMRQEFISNVSHEIQSPLTSISGFAKALQDDNISKEERLHYLQIIETESRRLSRLSENLLKLTSLESEHHPFERKRYRLDRQLRNLILACEPQWTAKNLELNVSLDQVEVDADEELLSQVWLNLLHNSIKFTPEHGKITVFLRKAYGRASVSIVDTGIGMNEEVKTHIFERFYKADKSRKRAGGGSGLGLAIVKKIIDMHEGSIEVNSAPDKGTEVIVTISCAPAVQS
ncbi:MAG TPA: HAMP domain-containing sensor histidine kinase [Bacillales bacterium]|nr:HAMP domain-containing sensor histidine kinase [Bacillales bacterium]